MTIKTRIADLEQNMPSAQEPLIILTEIVSPGTNGPVSEGLYSAYTPNGTIYPNEGETDAEFEARAERLASRESQRGGEL